MTSPEAKGYRRMKNMSAIQAASVRAEGKRDIASGKEDEVARAMGNFWRDARRERDLDIHEIAIRLGIPFSEMGMIEMGGKAETRDAFWKGPVPRELGSVIEDGLYEEFCERFNIPLYEESDNHPPQNTADNGQAPYKSTYLKQRY